jgi:hypothetical protein
VAGRRTFRILTSSQQSGFQIKKKSITSTQKTFGVSKLVLRDTGEEVLRLIHTYRAVLLPCTDCALTVPCRYKSILCHSLLNYTVRPYFIHTCRTVLLPCNNCGQTVSCRYKSTLCHFHFNYTVRRYLIHTCRTVLLPCNNCGQTLSCRYKSTLCHFHFNYTVRRYLIRTYRTVSYRAPPLHRPCYVSRNLNCALINEST